MSDLREAKAALDAVRGEAPGLPVMVSLTFDLKRRGYFTVMGDPLVPALCALVEAGAVVVGANCTLTSPQMAGLVDEALAGVDAPLVIQPNAGAPEAQVNGSFCTPRPRRTSPATSPPSPPPGSPSSVAAAAPTAVSSPPCAGASTRGRSPGEDRGRRRGARHSGRHRERRRAALPRLPGGAPAAAADRDHARGVTGRREGPSRRTRQLRRRRPGRRPSRRPRDHGRQRPGPRPGHRGRRHRGAGERAAGSRRGHPCPPDGRRGQRRGRGGRRPPWRAHRRRREGAGRAARGRAGCDVGVVPRQPRLRRLAADAQRQLFSRLPAREVGVKLQPSLLMVPRKSISFAMWLGAEARPVAGLSGCARCHLEHCRYRRREA